MSKLRPGLVVIVSTNQAGSIQWIDTKEVSVILENGDIWYGPPQEVRVPKNPEELKGCVKNVDKFKKQLTNP